MRIENAEDSQRLRHHSTAARGPTLNPDGNPQSRANRLTHSETMKDIRVKSVDPPRKKPRHFQRHPDN
ncbi:hypothetical protein JRI60_15260 [Archangium violaceum]|uniref:hypothetical protein n=1 Tax=Archangium violaceum TaxID=83451 RepID=UPI0019508984|nr:hypothetical protein [Archangium violaceum]QRO00281.1 hypothetical protein JRI60_15260 [Archangium violaceum]